MDTFTQATRRLEHTFASVIQPTWCEAAGTVDSADVYAATQRQACSQESRICPASPDPPVQVDSSSTHSKLLVIPSYIGHRTDIVY
jgi:hypothetical protein